MAIMKDSNGNYQTTGGLGYSTTSAPSGYNKTTSSGVTGISNNVENLEGGYVGQGSGDITYNLLQNQISELEDQNSLLYDALKDMETAANDLKDVLEANRLGAWLQEEVGQDLKNKITNNYNCLETLRTNLIDFYDGMARLCTQAENNNKR